MFSVGTVVEVGIGVTPPQLKIMKVRRNRKIIFLTASTLKMGYFEYTTKQARRMENRRDKSRAQCMEALTGWRNESALSGLPRTEAGL